MAADMGHLTAGLAAEKWAADGAWQRRGGYPMEGVDSGERVWYI